jgi:hypothetical protein
MRQRFEFLAAFVLLGLSASPVAAQGQNQSEFEVVLPRQPSAKEEVWLQVRLGELEPGSKLRISTRDGVLAGSVAPFGSRAAQEGSAYTVPLPQTAITSGRIGLRLAIVEPGKPPRPPEAGEVESIEPIYEAVGN